MDHLFCSIYIWEKQIIIKNRPFLQQLLVSLTLFFHCIIFHILHKWLEMCFKIEKVLGVTNI